MATKRFNLHLQPDLFESLRRAAFKERLPIAVLVRVAVAEWLGRRRGRRGQPARRGT